MPFFEKAHHCIITGGSFNDGWQGNNNRHSQATTNDDCNSDMHTNITRDLYNFPAMKAGVPKGGSSYTSNENKAWIKSHHNHPDITDASGSEGHFYPPGMTVMTPDQILEHEEEMATLNQQLAVEFPDHTPVKESPFDELVEHFNPQLHGSEGFVQQIPTPQPTPHLSPYAQRGASSPVSSGSLNYGGSRWGNNIPRCGDARQTTYQTGHRHPDLMQCPSEPRTYIDDSNTDP
ncbi:hypothetical protein BDQ12DRAFT_670972 [Crucibulum laeve]|uniref:Uncharacterized protein n=1 Tax=Crucibulum laeve TaxID=68775 RepID=A0A5C3LJX5_9AGAR|nr:hypothetical protein BDQ12DRAFT_670972 [Crucibulum laeve]